MRQSNTNGPHQGQPILTAGAALDTARGAMLLLHGRGASAGDILTLAEELVRTGPVEHGFAFLAPQAAADTWYPHPFLAPSAQNEPWLSSALARVEELFQQVQTAGVPAERTLLVGFSQGACLALEYAARHPRRYGGVAGLSGGLIGAEDEIGPIDGSLDGTTVFLGCSDEDPHIPRSRVVQTAEIFSRASAHVILRLYPEMGHTVNQDELAAMRDMMRRALENDVSGSSSPG